VIRVCEPPHRLHVSTQVGDELWRLELDLSHEDGITTLTFRQPGVTQEQVKAAETAGDVITRDLIVLLNTQYLTPFDREDIYQLATEIDDVVDFLEEASDLLGLYGVEMPTRHAVEQCAIIVQAVQQLSAACGNLKGMRGVQQALVEVKSLEDQGDRVLRDALASLFRDDRIDPLIVIRWKDIYEALERALDACETAANVIANILVKNA